MIIHGDSLNWLQHLNPNSIDAIVTDPPYNLGFMGKKWDNVGGPAEFQAWNRQWGEMALRVLKPGGSMLVMGGTRTWHRLAAGLEDAGFIIKDCLMWLYGSGFPKAQDLGKLIDKREGATPLAKHWDGFKIGGIKPAWEPILWLVKPPEGSWTDNVLAHGVGAVNVDECRVGIATGLQRPARQGKGITGCWHDYKQDDGEYGTPDGKGRFPANLLLSHHPDCPVRLLDEQSATSTSRFFYCAKASKREPYNDHPTLKPVKLFDHLVRLVTRPGQTVLDPFAGSGTTGVACIGAGRDFLLIEMDRHYCDICEWRVWDTRMGLK